MFGDLRRADGKAQTGGVNLSENVEWLGRIMEKSEFIDAMCGLCFICPCGFDCLEVPYTTGCKQTLNEWCGIDESPITSGLGAGK